MLYGTVFKLSLVATDMLVSCALCDAASLCSAPAQCSTTDTTLQARVRAIII